MARVGFTVEKFLQMTGLDADTGATILFGSAAPGGDTGEQDASEIGSIFLRTDTFTIYQKLANAGATADWYTYASLFDILGVSEGDVDLGSFTGGIVTNNSDVRTVIQEIIDYINDNLAEDISADGVTAVSVMDDEDVNSVLAVEYLVTISLNDDTTRRRTVLLTISHDGPIDGIADATETDSSVFAKHSHGAQFNYKITDGLSGTGAAQKMEFRVESTETNGVDVRARKIGQVLV